MSKKETPLILVFYIDVDTIKNIDIIQPFVKSVNEMIENKKENIMAFFLPTNGEEKVECINPIIATPEQIEKIDLMVEEIKNNFSVGSKMDELDIEITPENNNNNIQL